VSHALIGQISVVFNKPIKMKKIWLILKLYDKNWLNFKKILIKIEIEAITKVANWKMVEHGKW